MKSREEQLVLAKAARAHLNRRRARRSRILRRGFLSLLRMDAEGLRLWQIGDLPADGMRHV